MPGENLTEEIWWDLSYGFNIDEEKISWQNWYPKILFLG